MGQFGRGTAVAVQGKSPRKRKHARESECSPLLDREGLVLVDAEPHHLALGVEGVEVDVGDHAERARGRVRGQLGQVAVRKPRPPSGRPGGIVAGVAGGSSPGRHAGAAIVGGTSISSVASVFAGLSYSGRRPPRRGRHSSAHPTL